MAGQPKRVHRRYRSILRAELALVCLAVALGPALVALSVVRFGVTPEPDLEQLVAWGAIAGLPTILGLAPVSLTVRKLEPVFASDWTPYRQLTSSFLRGLFWLSLLALLVAVLAGAAAIGYVPTAPLLAGVPLAAISAGCSGVAFLWLLWLAIRIRVRAGG